MKTPQNVEQEMLVDKKVDLSKMVRPIVKLAVNGNQMQNVVGLIGKTSSLNWKIKAIELIIKALEELRNSFL